MKKVITFIFFIFVSFQSNILAGTPYFIDFKYILNESEAGKKAQKTLKTRLENNLKKLSEKQKKIQEEEKKIIQQKKIISPEEYKKKVSELRNKVSNLQKERNKILGDISEQRVKARNELF